MSELRWILLLVGVVFLIALTAWESRRARLARAAARERARAMSDTFPFEPPGAATTARTDASNGAGAVPAWLESGSGSGNGPALGELPTVPLEGPEALTQDDVVADEVAAADDTELAGEPGVPGGHGEHDEHGVAPDVVVPTLAAAAPAPPPATADELSTGTATSVTVEWPPEEQRRIVSVRIVSTSEQRLSGRATRQALAACGFVHGRYRIFHQPDAQGHALLSCASLNKPGMFDPNSMDYQRYSGLSLFTVLPGPLSPPDAVDRLLHTALDLSERLHARLQDEEGQTLDQARIAALLMRYRDLDAMAGPPE